MKKYPKILVVDDDKRYYEPLKDRAYNGFNLDLVVHEVWEEAESELRRNFDSFDAIILDGKGKLDQDSKGDDPNHLKKSLQVLDELKGKGLYIPRFVNTAYHEVFGVIFKDEKIFNKLKDEEKLFHEILQEINFNDKNRIKERYPEPFESFGDNYLPNQVSEKLMSVLLAIENNKWEKNDFNTLREIIEAIYISLHEIDDTLIPYTCLRYENGRVNFKYCALRLRGNDITGVQLSKTKKVVPDHLGWLIEPLEKVSSICSHIYKDEKYLNKYSLLTITFGVMEFLTWFKKFVDENYKNS